MIAEGSLFRELVAELKYRGGFYGLLSKVGLNDCCALVRARHEPGGSLEAAQQMLDDWLGPAKVKKVKDAFDVNVEELLAAGSLFRKLVEDEIKDRGLN